MEARGHACEVAWWEFMSEACQWGMPCSNQPILDSTRVLRIFLCVHDFVCIRMIDLFVVATCLHVGFEQCGSDELVVFAGIHGCVNSG